MQSDIKDAMTNRPPKFILKAKLVERVKENVNIIADTSATAILVGRGDLVGHMEKDKSYTIMLPEIKKIQNANCFVATKKAIKIQKDIVPNLKHLQGLKAKAELITEDFKKPEDSLDEKDTDNSNPSTITVLDIEKMKPNEKIRKVTLKLVNIGSQRGSGQKTFRVVKFRDKAGCPISANFYGKLQEQIKLKTVYHIEGITRSDFKSPSEDFHRFNTSEGVTRLIEYADPENQYKNLYCGDYLVRGTIVDFPYENLYPCCPSCKSRVEMVADKCGSKWCGKRLYEKDHDFNFKVDIISEDGEELQFFGFRRHLKEDAVVTTPEQLQDFFEKFKGETVEIDYSFKKDQNNIELLTVL